MDIYQNIRTLCKEHKTNISRLEQELGFSNGSLCKGSARISGERIKQIADYFDVPMEYIMTGKKPPYYNDLETDELYNLAHSNPEARFLLSETMNMSKEDLKYIIDLIKRLTSK